MTKITTERLILRNFQEKDAEDLFDYLSKPSVNCFSKEKINTLEEALSEAKKRSNDAFQLAIELSQDNKVIGHVFADFKKPDTYAVGWQFNENYGGKGYATEAASALFTYLFDQKEARRIYAYVEDDNFPSQKLCERLGMRKEGCFQEFISFVNHADGTPKYENTYQYAILKKEWALQQRNQD
ncbi:GNAT family N-acetyltransferase [Amphibacillus jilinensis]|uniref:GNAT family N-acetyltransferase n=1 Tax=Amphibacillus jilinensis TaxID=1216008 RepID=UPI0002DF34EE|nr:GNAT family protein [Amphibacillus jilinensis]